MNDSIERVATTSLAETIAGPHGHRSLVHANGQELILAVNEVPFPWHRHPGSAELFITLSGSLAIESEACPAVELNAGDAAVVPAGMWHRTVPKGRAVNLILKPSGAMTEFRDEAAQPNGSGE